MNVHLLLQAYNTMELRMPQRTRSLIALSVVFFSFVHWVGQVGAADGADIQARLIRVLEYLRPQKFNQSVLEVHDRVAAHSSKSYGVHLISGVGNAIVAACGSDCGYVEITLYDYQGKSLGPPTAAKKDLVIMKGNPQYTGLYEVEIAVPDCRASECQVGLMVLLQRP